MPERQTRRRAKRDKAQGKAASTQAGEFVREEIHHVREGKHGARSPKQAIAIGLSKARRSGVDLPPPEEGKASEGTRRKARREYERGHGAPATSRASPKRKASSRAALKREGKRAGTRGALSEQTRRAAARRKPSERSAAAKKGARTKGPARRASAARKASRTRAAEERE
jgi:hypothetical protein